MKQSDYQNQEKTKTHKVTIYPVPFTLEEIKENFPISTNTPS